MKTNRESLRSLRKLPLLGELLPQKLLHELSEAHTPQLGQLDTSGLGGGTEGDVCRDALSCAFLRHVVSESDGIEHAHIMRMKSEGGQGKLNHAHKRVDSCAENAHKWGNDMANTATSQSGRVPLNLTLPADLKKWALEHANGSHYGDLSHMLEAILKSRKVRQEIEARKAAKRKAKKAPTPQTE